MQIRALNFKPCDRPNVIGYFSLGYGGLAISGCKLMVGRGQDSAWVALPSRRIERDDEIEYRPFLFFSKIEMSHIRRTVIEQVKKQGFMTDINNNNKEI